MSRGQGTVQGAGDKGFELRRVDKAYGDVRVFSAADAQFGAGRVHVVGGPSGEGKTTLLRLLMGLEEPDAGTVARPLGARLAATFQEDRLCDNLTATANLRVPHGRLRGAERDAFVERSREALGAVGVPADARPVRELSGGQRRRVAILRAVLADADALFFDEPLKGMDAATLERVMAFVAPRLERKTVFWVTHDEGEARWFGEACLWRVRDGRVEPVR